MAQAFFCHEVGLSLLAPGTSRRSDRGQAARDQRPPGRPGALSV